MHRKKGKVILMVWLAQEWRAVEDWVMGAVYTFVSLDNLASVQVEVLQAAAKIININWLQWC
jgi:hypothetical protein